MTSVVAREKDARTREREERERELREASIRDRKYGTIAAIAGWCAILFGVFYFFFR